MNSKSSGHWKSAKETGRSAVRKGAKKRSERTDATIAKAFHASSAAMAISLLSDGKIIDVNERWVKFFGARRSKLIGKIITSWAWKDPKDRQQVVRVLKKKGVLQDREVHLRKRNGEDLIALISARVFKIDTRQIIISSLIDITAHKQAQEALSRSEERFRTIADFSPDIISTFNSEGQLVFNSAAAARIHGYGADDLLNRSTFDLIHPEDRAVVEDAFGRLLQNRAELVNVQYRYRNADGSYVWMEAIGRNELKNPDINGIIAISRDITERKKAEESLRQLNVTLEQHVAERTAKLTEVNRLLRMEMTQREKLREEIFHAIEREQERIGMELHDGVCQILTGARCFNDTLRAELIESSPHLAENIDRIDSLLEESIEQIRGLSCGLNPVSEKPEGLAEALRELAFRMDSATGVRCVFEMARPVEIANRMAASHLFRIAQEAVQNAFRHSHAKHIAISLRQRSGVITMSIKDDGRGIKAQAKGKSGSGIAHMRKRARLIGATLEIRLADHRGTTIYCRLRAAQTE